MAFTIEEGKQRIVELLIHVARSRGVLIDPDAVRWASPANPADDDVHVLIVKGNEEISGDAWAELESTQLTSFESDEGVWNELLTILREEIVDDLRDY